MHKYFLILILFASCNSVNICECAEMEKMNEDCVRLMTSMDQDKWMAKAEECQD